MTVKEYVKRNLNVPNVLTLVRLFLVPVYVLLFTRGQKHWALAVFLLASFTDLLDGRIARKYHLITNFGKLMDPLADKVMVLTAMFSLAIGNQAIPPVMPWAAVLVVLAKEALMVLGGAYLLKRGVVVYSAMVGKVAHCLFIAGLVLCFFHDWFLQRCAAWPATPDLLVVWCAVALTLCALVVYAVDNLKKLRNKEA